MKFYNRNGMLYARINGRRVSTKLKDTKENRKLFKSYAKNEEFFKKFGVNNEVPTVLELCEEVLIEKESELKPSSLSAYRSCFISCIVPYFNKYVNEIDPLFIDSWYKTFKGKSQIVTCEAILKPAFEKAILRKYISSTPFVITKPRLKSNYQINPFTIDEMRKILSYDSFIKNLLAMAFFTGMRIGELMALKWSDIDFSSKTINIERNMYNGVIETPKTIESIGVIDLPIEVVPYLKEQQFKTGLKEFIFYREDGKLFRYSSNVTYYYHKLLDALKIKIRGIHQTRHTFASQKLSIGERLEWVSFMLRHKSPQITLNTYYKYIPRENEKRVILDLGLTQNRHSS